MHLPSSLPNYFSTQHASPDDYAPGKVVTHPYKRWAMALSMMVALLLMAWIATLSGPLPQDTQVSLYQTPFKNTHVVGPSRSLRPLSPPRHRPLHPSHVPRPSSKTPPIVSTRDERIEKAVADPDPHTLKPSTTTLPRTLKPSTTMQEKVVPHTLNTLEKLGPSLGALGLIAGATLLGSHAAEAADKIDPFFAGFQPVCPYSDNVFRVGQRMALGVAGESNIEDYRPLINDILIRVRTELCVLESFTRETAVPFIQQKGLGWFLPARETSETYLAGVIFVVGSNFIVLGSTKVLAILSIYHDLVVGLPARFVGRFLGETWDNQKKLESQLDKLAERQTVEVQTLMIGGSNAKIFGLVSLPTGPGNDKEVDEAQVSADRMAKVQEISAKYAGMMEEVKQQMTNEEVRRRSTALGRAEGVARTVSVPLIVYGKTSAGVREILEIFDTFCSRYFVTFTVTYVLIKTVHYVVFPNFP